MTAKFFTEWLLKIDFQFKKENLNIILFMDNFSGHYTSVNDSLTNVKIVTSRIQQLDQGIKLNIDLK